MGFEVSVATLHPQWLVPVDFAMSMGRSQAEKEVDEWRQPTRSTPRPLPSSREDVDSCAQRHELGYCNINGLEPCRRVRMASSPGQEVRVVD